jgi:hypothetical protein
LRRKGTPARRSDNQTLLRRKQRARVGDEGKAVGGVSPAALLFVEDYSALSVLIAGFAPIRLGFGALFIL